MTFSLPHFLFMVLSLFMLFSAGEKYISSTPKLCSRPRHLTSKFFLPLWICIVSPKVIFTFCVLSFILCCFHLQVYFCACLYSFIFDWIDIKINIKKCQKCLKKIQTFRVYSRFFIVEENERFSSTLKKRYIPETSGVFFNHF